jgi:hypothetical protein
VHQRVAATERLLQLVVPRHVGGDERSAAAFIPRRRRVDAHHVVPVRPRHVHDGATDQAIAASDRDLH